MSSKRALAIGGLVLVVAAVLLALWLRRDRSPRAAEATASASATTATAAAAAAGQRRHEPPVRDPEPAGSIRLEGLVVDEDDRPVAGAEVELSSQPPRRVQSDTDGSFAIEGLRAQHYVIHAWSGDRYAPRTRFTARPTTEPILLHLRRGNTVDVMVLDAVTDQPIAGAEIDDRRTIQITDAAGRATVRALAPSFNVLEIRHPDYALHVDTFTLSEAPDGTTHRRVRLVRGVAVAGRVLAPNGAPVAGAAVELGQLFATSDRDGRFAFAHCAPGAYSATAELAGFSPGAAEFECRAAGQPELIITLAAERRLDGLVVDASGAPAPDARVTVGTNVAVQRSAITGPDGRFTIAGLGSRRYGVAATRSDTAAEAIEVDLATTDRATVRLTLAPGAIAGVVVDERGEPVAEARVRATPGGRGLVLSFGEDITDPHGRFEIGPLLPGTYRLRAASPDDPDTNRYHGDHVEAATGATDARLVLPASGAITGVVTVSGQPAPHYAVMFSTSEFTLVFDTAELFRAADGRFTRRHLAPGTYMVTIVGEGFARQVRRDVVVKASRTTDLGTLDATAGREVRGRVVDERGQPVADVTVAASRHLLLQGDSFGQNRPWAEQRAQGLFTTTTAADGSFVLRGLDPDTAGVRAVALQDTRRMSPAVELGDDTVLTLAPTGTLDGRITSLGAAHVTLTIDATATHGFDIVGHVDDDDGTVHLPLVPTGRRTVTAAARTGRANTPTSVEIVVEPGAATTVTIDGAALSP